MPEMLDVASELEAVHVRANAAYRAREVGAYMSVFAPTLRYKQADGHTIGKDQLAHDVEAQFRVVVAADSSYVREALQVDGDQAIEVCTQTATATTRHFLFFKRSWRISRRGRYTWVRLPDGWKIQEVEILTENVG